MSAALTLTPARELGEGAEFYALPSPTSDLSRHSAALRLFTGTPAEAARWARNAVLHVMDLPRLGLHVGGDRMADMNIRSAAQVVDLVLGLNAAPLHEPRPPEQRMIGLCHHLSLLACALLRHVGVPARLRYGFVPYFKQGVYEDHCVCEVFVGGSWRLFDPGQGLEVGDELADTFVSGGEAWRRCRRGECDPDLFGSEDPFEGNDWRGWWYIRDNVVRDFGALCKLELHPCDLWGLMVTDPEDQPAEVIDELASLTLNDAAWDDRLARFERDPAVNPCGRVTTFDGLARRFREVELSDRW